MGRGGLERAFAAQKELTRAAPDNEGNYGHAQTERARDGHEVRAYDDALEFIAQVRDTKRRETVLKQAFPDGALFAARRRQYAAPRAWKIVAYDTIARDLEFIRN